MVQGNRKTKLMVHMCIKGMYEWSLLDMRWSGIGHKHGENYILGDDHSIYSSTPTKYSRIKLDSPRKTRPNNTPVTKSTIMTLSMFFVPRSPSSDIGELLDSLDVSQRGTRRSSILIIAAILAQLGFYLPARRNSAWLAY